MTAEAETVAVHASQDGDELLDRRFLAPRRTEADLLAEAIEAPRRDIVSDGAIRMAARMVAPREIGAKGLTDQLGPRGGRPVLPLDPRQALGRASPSSSSTPIRVPWPRPARSAWSTASLSRWRPAGAPTSR